MFKSRTDDERWADVLAGRATPTDDETRVAAGLRELLLNEPPLDEMPLDAAAVTRVMNALEARGAFKPRPQPDTGAPTTRPAEPRQGTLRPGAPRSFSSRPAAAALPAPVIASPGLRWAMGCVAVIAALVTAFPPGNEPDEPDLIPKGGGAALPPGRQVHAVPDPEASARELAALLNAHGTAARVGASGSAWTVSATVPAARLPEAADALASRGLTVGAEGRVVVRFEPVGSR